MKDVKKSEIAILLSELFRWQRTWRDNDIEEYLDFYDKDFKRYDGMSRKDFSKRKRNLFSRNQKKEIVFSNINISPYPDESGKRLFKIAFHQKFTTKTYKFRGNKELFVELIGDSFKIITER
jgi:murein L,D-transpeptidase YafK